MVTLEFMSKKEQKNYISKVLKQYTINLSKFVEQDVAINETEKHFKVIWENNSRHGFYKIKITGNNREIGKIWYVFNRKQNFCFVPDIEIDKDYRSQGYGTQSLVLVEKQLKEKKIDTILVTLFNDQTNALNFLKRLGYKTMTTDNSGQTLSKSLSL